MHLGRFPSHAPAEKLLKAAWLHTWFAFALPLNKLHTWVYLTLRLTLRTGFIRSTSRALDLFFHHSDLHPDLPPEQLNVGLEVQFTPCRDPGSNRLVAKAVQRAASGTVVFHVLSEQQYLGQVLDLPVQLWAAGPASATSATAATAAATATATAMPLPAPAGNAASPRASPLDTAPASNALVGHNAHAGSADTPSQPSCSAAPSPCSHHTPSLESPGIIRYLPEAGRVQHIMFRSCDVAAGGCRGGALQPEALVLFNICTDKRAASNAVRASGKGGGVSLGGSTVVEAMDTGAGSVSCVSTAELRAGSSAGEVGSAAGSASGATGCRASHHAANRAVKVSLAGLRAVGCSCRHSGSGTSTETVLHRHRHSALVAAAVRLCNCGSGTMAVLLFNPRPTLPWRPSHTCVSRSWRSTRPRCSTWTPTCSGRRRCCSYSAQSLPPTACPPARPEFMLSLSVMAVLFAQPMLYVIYTERSVSGQGSGTLLNRQRS